MYLLTIHSYYIRYFILLALYLLLINHEPAVKNTKTVAVTRPPVVVGKIAGPVMVSLPVVVDKPKVKPRGVGNGSCVALAQARGFKIHVGAARNWPTGAKKLGYIVNDIPEVGAVVVTNESSRGTNSGHVAIILAIVNDGRLLIEEQNYKGKYIVSKRVIPPSKIVAIIHPLTKNL